VVFIHNGIYSATKKNEIFSFANKWVELENIILSKARLKRPKIACSPSYADYRLKINLVIFLDLGHTLRGEHAWE
jgi:hypothetical protein